MTDWCLFFIQSRKLTNGIRCNAFLCEEEFIANAAGLMSV
jgi:hypothetical protein